ncbi:FecR family protein [Constantimarinum furrinae]|uniref:FecR family protein n=1 Tax=Constantimarinum furrinae TaxID=2562285 RepID=A0A7G8PUQ5_9FLAO|nr:FecR domain-containing protein [Constantimarinum furrinae]QNJ98071.1 hypothetical protein ALE3EI_1513 [Constantimarinum furrinae]
MKKEDLLEKWLNGEITSAELEVLRTMPEFSSYHKIDEYVKRMQLPVHHTREELSILKQKLSPKKVERSAKVISLSTVIKIAAVLVLLLASYVYIDSLPTTVKTAVAETETIYLPDGSSVILNGASQILYKERGWNNERELELAGEAFFEVAKGETFTVNTEQGSITVLGTKFNVFSKQDNFVVKCFEGRVYVSHNGTGIELSKGETATVLNNQLTKDRVYSSRPGWIFNESSYDDVMLKNVLKELEKQYNIRVSTKNIDVNLRFTGSFTHENLEAALQTVTLPFGFNYSINNTNAVTIFANEPSQE